GRQAKSGDHAHESGVLLEERHAVQRQRGNDRVFPGAESAGERAVDYLLRNGGRSDLPANAVHRELSFQKAAGCFQVEPDGLFGKVVGSFSARDHEGSHHYTSVRLAAVVDVAHHDGVWRIKGEEHSPLAYAQTIASLQRAFQGLDVAATEGGKGLQSM